MRRSIALTVAVATTAGLLGLASQHNGFAGTQHGHPSTPEPSISGGIATFQRTARLGAVAQACAKTATTERPGAVVLRRGLQDAHTTVTFAVPCAIQLAGASSVALADVRVSSRTLNIADTAFGAGANTVALANTRFTGGADAGLLVQLSDPADRVVLGGGSLQYPAGIAMQVRGDRSGVDSGGTVLVSRTTLSARGTDSTGITVTASTKHGRIVGDQPR